MRHNAFTVVLAIVATLFSVSCNKEDYKDDGPSTLPREKVSRIYSTAHIVSEMLSPITGTWITLMDITNDRSLLCEFTWNGERLEGMKTAMSTYSFVYDDSGRLIRAECMDNSDKHYEFTYNADGLLVRIVAFTKDSDGGLDSKRTSDFTWADGHLLKAEEDYWARRVNGDESTSRSTHIYTWDGDDVSSTKRTTLNGDGTTEVFNYAYEYTSIANPLQGFVLSQDCYFGLVWSFEGIDGLSDHLLAHVVSDNADVTYEYTVSGDRVSTINKHYVAQSDDTMRMITDTFFEFEY